MLGTVLLLLTQGCGNGEQERAETGCDRPARADLGFLVTYNNRAGAWFTTSGGEHYFSARWPSRYPWNDAWGYYTHLGFGPAADPPRWNGGTKPVNEVAGVSGYEGDLIAVTLEPGRYWVTSTDGAVISVDTCPPTQISQVKRTRQSPPSKTPAPTPTDDDGWDR